ncbi:hypothetical protein MMC06_004798 [Schaereria dolodes]|nr:hypothetical protein [Schaereria dolodes]
MGKVGRFFKKIRRASIAKIEEVLEVIFTSPDLEPSFQGVPAIEVRPTSPRSIQQRLTTPNSSRDSVPPGELRVCNPDRPKSKDSLFPPSNLTARPVEEILPDGPLTAHSFELQVTEEEEENERQVVPGDDRSPLLLKPCGGRGFYTIIEESQESLSLLFPDCPEPAFSNRYKISEVSVSIEELRPNAEEAARGVLFKRKPLVERLTRHYRPSYSSRKHVCPEPPLPIITASNLIAPPPPPNHQAARHDGTGKRACLPSPAISAPLSRAQTSLLPDIKHRITPFPCLPSSASPGHPSSLWSQPRSPSTTYLRPMLLSSDVRIGRSTEATSPTCTIGANAFFTLDGSCG